MDDLVERVGRMIWENLDLIGTGNSNTLAGLIIPMIYEDAARICEAAPHDWPDGTVPRANAACAQSIRSRVLDMAK